MSDNNSTGWRPAKDHGLPDGTMVLIGITDYDAERLAYIDRGGWRTHREDIGGSVAAMEGWSYDPDVTS